MLDHIWGWYERECAPLALAFDRGHQGEALSALDALRSSLETAEADEDDRTAMGILLDYLEYSLYASSGDGAGARSLGDRLAAELAAPLPLTYSEIVRRRC